MIEERIPWTVDEAVTLIEAVKEKDTLGLTWDDIALHMEDAGFTNRGGGAYRDANRRNPIVRRLRFGDREYEERVKEQRAVTNDGAVSIINPNRPRTVEEMADIFGVDTEIYEDTKIVTNQWANNWQTKVWWAIKEAPMATRALLGSDLLELIKGAAGQAMNPGMWTSEEDLIDIIEIVDAHHGMLAWAPEVGTNWDLSLSTEEHERAFTFFLDEQNSNECVIRIGDDTFHFDKLIDGKAGATFKGTVQDVDSRWQKLFLKVVELEVKLLKHALDRYEKVHVVLIQGNHDWQTSFYLGQVLNAAFLNEPRITFDIRPRTRKYIQFGTSLIGMVHKHGKLGLNSLADKIREEPREAWGKTDYAEFHMADHHHEEVMDRTGTGVVIRKLRALVPNDSWHDNEGYSSHRGAQMFTFHRTEGIFDQKYYRTRRQAPYRPDVAPDVTIL